MGLRPWMKEGGETTAPRQNCIHLMADKIASLKSLMSLECFIGTLRTRPTSYWGALGGHSGWSPYWWQHRNNSPMITAPWGTIRSIQVYGVPGPWSITHHFVTSLLGNVRHWGTACFLRFLQILKAVFTWGSSHVLARFIFHLKQVGISLLSTCIYSPPSIECWVHTNTSDIPSGHILEPAAFPSKFTEGQGNHREHGGQGKLKC